MIFVPANSQEAFDPSVDFMQPAKGFKPDPSDAEKKLYVKWLRDNLRHAYATKVELYQAIRTEVAAPPPVAPGADPNEALARAYLAVKGYLRLYILFSRANQDDTSGAGHLEAARASVDNLMLLGFQGNLEVIYTNNEWTKRDIVGSGFPTFPGGGQMNGPGGTHCTVSYIDVNDVGGSLQREVGLVNNLDVFMEQGDTFTDVVNNTLILFGDRNMMKVNQMVVLKSFGWDAGYRWIYNYANDHSQAVAVTNNVTGYRNGGAVNAFDNVAPKDVPATVTRFMSANPLTPVNANATSSLSKVLERVHKGEIELVVVYGLHNGGTPTTIQAIAKATREAIKWLKLSDEVNKPAVVLLLRNTNVVVPVDALAADKILSFAAGDPGAADGIAKLKDGQVAVLNAPGVPRAVFNQFMMSSTLPFFLEGAGSVTTAVSLGVPFISLKDNSSIVDVPNTTAGTTSDILRAHGRWLTAGGHVPTAEEINALAKSMVDSRTPTSPLYDYYKKERTTYLSAGNYQMAIAFAALANGALN